MLSAGLPFLTVFYRSMQKRTNKQTVLHKKANRNAIQILP